MPLAPLPSTIVTSKNVSRHCQISGEGREAKITQLRTTIIDNNTGFFPLVNSMTDHLNLIIAEYKINIPNTKKLTIIKHN